VYLDNSIFIANQLITQYFLRLQNYLEHPGLLFGLFWAFWLFVSFGVSLLCVPLSFITKLSGYVYRTTRAILWGTIPLILLFILASIYDPADSKSEWWFGLFISCLPTLLALIAFLRSRKKCPKQ
jgi:hypothetical protein